MIHFILTALMSEVGSSCEDIAPYSIKVHDKLLTLEPRHRYRRDDMSFMTGSLSLARSDSM